MKKQITSAVLALLGGAATHTFATTDCSSVDEIGSDTSVYPIPGNDPDSACIELRETPTDPVLALIKRYGSSVRLTEFATYLERQDNGTQVGSDDYFLLKSGADYLSGSPDASCDATFVTNRFYLADKTNPTGCNDLNSISFNNLRGVALNTITCTDCSSNVNPVQGANEVILRVLDGELAWDYPGRFTIPGDCQNPGGIPQLTVDEWCLIREDWGVNGAKFTVRITDGGYVSEQVVAIIEAIGIDESDCSDCPTSPTLGACTFSDGQADCDCVQDMLEADCIAEGGSWDSGGSCSGSFDGCQEIVPIHDLRTNRDEEEATGELTVEDCASEGEEIGNGTTTTWVSSHATANPIEHISGQKIEAATDLSMSYPGGSYSFTRQYRSGQASRDVLSALGRGWTGGNFMHITVSSGTSPTVTLRSGNSKRVYSQVGTSGVWTTGGPTDQYFEKAVYSDALEFTHGSNGMPVWQLVDPDGRRWLFLREKDSAESGVVDIDAAMEGLLFLVLDGRGSQQRYHYAYFGAELDDITTSPVARVRSIELQSVLDIFGTVETHGEITFDWNADKTHPNRGTLRRVSASRWNSTVSEFELIEDVQYSYAGDLGLSYGSWSHLGTRGDLIQVTRRIRLDDDTSASPAKPVFRELITQYRYHRDDADIDDLGDDNDNDGVPGDKGEAHQLRMVFTPFEVEHFAEQTGASSLKQAARNLLKLEDGDTAFGTTTVAQLASKVIARYENDRVIVQFIQASCGCAGISSGQLGIERIYSYWMDAATVDGSNDFTFSYDERIDGATDYRRFVSHLERVNRVPLLVAEAIIDPSNDDAWVYKYEYTTKGELKAKLYPSAIDHEDYDPFLGTAPGFVVPFVDKGLVQGYVYNAQSKPTAMYVRAGYDPSKTMGTSGSGWHVMQTMEYGDSNRPDLLTAVNRFRIESELTTTVGANNIERTEFAYTYYSPTTLDYQPLMAYPVATITTKVERELDTENGPTGTGTYDSVTVLDLLGRSVLQRGADFSLTETVYDNFTGGVSKIRRNINGTDAEWSPPSSGIATAPSGLDTGIDSWGRSADGGSLTTEYTRDRNGRVIMTTGPDGIKSYTYRTMATSPYRGALFNDSLTYYSQITLPHIMNSGATEFNGMASQVWLDAAGSMVEQKGFALTDASSYDSSDQEYREAAPILVDVTNSLAVLASRSATESDFAGKSVEMRTWHDVTEVAGAPYVESASFDEIGRLEQSTDANGTITVYSYDIHDRQTQVRVGTSTLALVTVAEMFYDSNGTTTSGVGDGNVTLQRLHVDGSNHRDTEYRYDNRNRLVWTINELAPHSYTEYDNLGRAVTSHASSVAPTALEAPAQANRIASSSTAYSQRGLMWQSSVEIDPTSAPNDDLLVSQQWFDEVGRTIKSQSAGGPGTKVAYDGLGRATHRFTGEMLGETYANVYDTTTRKPKVDGDVILEESVTIYGIDPDQRGFSRAVLTKSYQREHNSSSTGSLSDYDGSADPTAIVTFSGVIYDNANRPVKSGYFGTNDSSGYVAGGTAPDMQPSTGNDFGSGGLLAMPGGALTSQTLYDNRGRAYVTIGPDGTRSRVIFDDLNRSIAEIENDKTASEVMLSWSTNRWATTNAGGGTNPDDQNRVTSFVYDGIGNIVRRVAHIGDSNYQETVYDYAYDGAVIDSNSLLASIRYPDETNGQAGTGSAYTVNYEYNRLGEMTQMTDQNATVHAYTYDAMGRITLDAVSTFGLNLDQTVKAIQYAYSPSTGLMERVSSLDGTNPGTATVLNEIRYEYDDMLVLSKYRQNPTGAVGSGNSADVEYFHSRVSANAAGSGTKNFSRVSELRYPLINSGGKQRTTLAQHYGTAGSLDDKISRPRGFDWQFQSASVADHAIRYDYLGMGNPVIVDYEDANLRLDRHIDPSYTGGVTPGEYAGMDQYGRLTRQVWGTAGGSWSPGTKPALIDVAYTYDVNSDIIQRYDARHQASLAGRGDRYTYDGLNRLASATRGKPDGTGWTDDGTRGEDWQLDIFGNWNSYENRIAPKFIEESRDHNQANELIENTRTEYTPPATGTPVDLDSTYDDAGNLRTRMVSDSVRWVYTWDAWNRLVKVDIEEYKAGEWLSLAPRLHSSYYGLNQRAWSRLDAGAAGYVNNGVPSNALNRMELFYYDASWRLLERRSETWNGTSFVHDSTSQWIWGQRYIDELVASITDTDLNDEFDQSFYAMTDRNFSVIGLSNGERVRYDAYGQAQGSPYGDADADGIVGIGDLNMVLADFGKAYGTAGYRVESDLNADGSINLADLNLVNARSGNSIGRGNLSRSGNIVGYAGYIFEPATGMYVVRHRWYSTGSGRWLSRDPLGYVDGQNMLQHALSNPIRYKDPYGEQACGKAACGSNESPDGDDKVKKKDNDVHYNKGGYYKYKVKCTDPSGSVIEFSEEGWTQALGNMIRSIKGLQNIGGGSCCLTQITLGAHHAGGTIWTDWDREEAKATAGELIDSLTLCDEATVNLEMCNSCKMAEGILTDKKNIHKKISITCTEGSNSHYPVFTPIGVFHIRGGWPYEIGTGSRRVIYE